ncbi:MAG: GIY-YIG nuclease family protein [Candidatus Acidiferrum sp.]
MGALVVQQRVPIVSHMNHLPNLTIEFVENAADGLRLITHSNWVVECLVSSRVSLPKSFEQVDSFKWLDVPGVYLLIGPTKGATEGSPEHDFQLYVGQADSVAERLGSHLKSEKKKWWRTVVVLRRTDKNPLNLSQCKFLESRLCDLALKADRCSLANGNAPQLPVMSAPEQSSTEDFLMKSLVILSALGWNFFPPPQPVQEPPSVPKGEGEPPQVPPNLKPLLEELKNAVMLPSFPKAVWYWTHIPDYRAKVVGDADTFRVFARVHWAKGWFRVGLTDVGNYKVKTKADIDEELRRAIAKAYQNAENYLQGGK